jgi:transposase
MDGSRVQGARPRPEPLQFVLRYKRLERGRFRLPRVSAEARSVIIDATELAMLLDGIDVVAVKRPRKWEPPKIAAAAPT